MVTIKLKGVNKVFSKGRVYYYYGRGRNSVRLRGEPGTPEFLASYETARSPLHRMDKKRLRAWVALYRAKKFPELAQTTQRIWRPWLDRIQEHFGDLSIRQFDNPRIRVDICNWCDRWEATPRTADFAKQVLSRVLAYAVEKGGLQSNPCEGMPTRYRNNRSDRIWTAEDLDALLKAASPEVAWAARLAVLTGLRQGDLLRLSWSHVSETAITMPTSKSSYRRAALIPVYGALRDLLNEIPRRATTVLTNGKGLPWRGFGSSWTKVVKLAGLADKDLHFHDLRGTAATTFFRAGFKPSEIAEIMAWSPDKVERLINLYVKRDELILDRIRRLDQHAKGT